jgi:hypothetical protein
MKLNGTQRDTLHSLVITQNVNGAIQFVEDLFGGQGDGESTSGVQSSAVEDSSGGLQQASSGSDPSVEDTARKRSGKKS